MSDVIMGVKIDSGLPIPARAPQRKTGATTPEGAALRALEVGQSFVWPRRKGETAENARHRATAHLHLHKPKRFSSRYVDENGTRELRVWRIA